MRFSLLALALFLAVSTAGASSAGGRKMPDALLRFSAMPLGNVARILSARFATTITIGANARAPITGDFSSMGLAAALHEAARQAGLTVVPPAHGASAGFCLVAGRPAPAAGAAPGHRDQPSAAVQAALAEAASRRAVLLNRREDLLDQNPATE